MKRRKFLSHSLMGAAGLAVGASINNPFTPAKATANPGNVDIPSLAPRPPLGWNSFDSYGVYLHHDAAMANIKAMAEKLLPHGYEYFVIDGGWYGEFKLVEGTMYPAERHAENANMNEYGIYQPSKTYFPHGFKPIIDYARELGLKTGIHLMRGISRKAVEQNLPIKNSSYRAADVADRSSICTWNSQNYGIDTSMPGAQDWYDSVINQVAEWGFDFIKFDDLTTYPKEIIAIANAIEKSGRNMVYSLSPGDKSLLPHLPYYRRANLLRISSDIWDRTEDIDKGFNAWKQYMGFATDGFWPDLDMIPFGQLLLMSPERFVDGSENVNLAGFGNTRWSQFSKAQMRTFITMRALAASPLFVGGDLPTMDDYSLHLLTDSQMLKCNQNGVCGILVTEKDNTEVWITKERENPKSGWLGIFNRSGKPISLEYTKEELGLMQYTNGYALIPFPEEVELADIWKDNQYVIDKEPFKINIEADDVCFLRFS
jgi:alpha-galactosidase